LAAATTRENSSRDGDGAFGFGFGNRRSFILPERARGSIIVHQ
jgi:hypothetical protein